MTICIDFVMHNSITQTNYVSVNYLKIKQAMCSKFMSTFDSANFSQPGDIKRDNI